MRIGLTLMEPDALDAAESSNMNERAFSQTTEANVIRDLVMCI